MQNDFEEKQYESPDSIQPEDLMQPEDLKRPEGGFVTA